MVKTGHCAQATKIRIRERNSLKKKEIKHFDKGIFTLSLDTELAWGTVDKPVSLINNKEYYYETREAIDGIIELLEKYEISATWAIVGSMLLDRPRFEEQFIKHITDDLGDRIKVQYIDLLKDERIWCGKDILEKIKSCSVPQEIGSHSYSHIIFGDDTISREKAIKEFANGMDILKKYGEQPKSFIFPRNSVNYLTELQNACVKTYRGVEPSWYMKIPGKLKKICHMLDQALAISPPVVTPTFCGGLVNIPASMLYLSMSGFRKYIPLKSRVKKAKKGIQKAIDEKKIFHLWFHPFNIATDKEKLLKGLDDIFKMVKRERDAGNLEVMTMSGIAAKVSV